jgi:hypothetical protein
MSYLNSRQDIPSFKKAVISLWFKVPQASLDKAGAAADTPVLNGIVPLVVMGQEGSYNAPYNTDVSRVVQSVVTGTYGSAQPDIRTDNCINYTTVVIGGTPITYCSDQEITYTWSPGLTWVQTPPQYDYANVQSSSISGPGPSKSPSYIGVDSNGFLYVNFETAKQGNASNLSFEIQSIAPGSQTGPSPPFWSGGASSPPPNPWAFAVGTNITIIHYAGPVDFVGTVTSNVVGQTWENNPAAPGSITHPVNNWADITNVVLNATGSIGNNGTQVTADEWHHVLVSVDLTNPIETHGTSSRLDVVGPISPYVDSAVKLYLAVDDVNKTTWDLSVWVYPDGGPNDVITQEAADVAGAIRTYDVIYSNGDSQEVPVGGIASYSLDASIPSGVIGLPATSKYVSEVLHCEMAEFQMWIGASLDTGVEANRRVFIDYKRDSTGAPIPDKNGKLTLVPVDPAKAASLIGRRPDVELHKSSNWIKGSNTGSTGVGPDGKPISAGQFTPTGVIKKYKPDPSIVVT